MITVAAYASPLGSMLLAQREDQLIGAWFEGQRYDRASLRKPISEGITPLLQQTQTWLNGYFRGEAPDPHDLPLSPEGSAFRQVVWSLLMEIPWGQTITYGTLAKKAAERMGQHSMSAQAIGGAVGHNPISIIIPCHRVIGASGSLTGYAGGLERKRALLMLEGSLRDPALTDRQ